jgi:topoisomerase-4 subunit A
MGKATPPPEPAEIHEVALREALEERYLAYALSTIMHRALPDARDGLKPVHRRILYGMRLLRLDPGTAFKKSAKIVGDVMGSFHPHGDQAIYDAMVRLAQDFSSRYPLVDGQGNFGNIDGDNAAAYRYTEARMTDVARLLLDGIDEDGVEFRPNYDGQTKEPSVMPGGFPNLLANGAQGIAVGMATSIPPHNAAELCDAALHLIEKPDALGQGTGFPDRRHRHRFQGGDHRGLHYRPWFVPRPRQVEAGGGQSRHLGRGRHRDSVPGAEVAADREDRRSSEREEAAAGRRHQG